MIIDSNPVFTAPADSGFAEALKRVPFSLALANHVDETARSTTWFVPKTHDWESWSDARAYDGTVTILQPQALPLYGGTSAHELLALYLDSTPAVFGVAGASDLDGAFRGEFRESLARCARRGHRLGHCERQERCAPARRCGAGSRRQPRLKPAHLTILFRPDPSLWDGRYANNPWLQELPRPLTKLVWDNPLLIAPALAQQMDLKNGDCVRLSVGRASVVAPVWIMPGQAPACITALLGSGRRAAGSIGNRRGRRFLSFDRHRRDR